MLSTDLVTCGRPQSATSQPNEPISQVGCNEFLLHQAQQTTTSRWQAGDNSLTIGTLFATLPLITPHTWRIEMSKAEALAYARDNFGRSLRYCSKGSQGVHWLADPKSLKLYRLHVDARTGGFLRPASSTELTAVAQRLGVA